MPVACAQSADRDVQLRAVVGRINEGPIVRLRCRRTKRERAAEVLARANRDRKRRPGIRKLPGRGRNGYDDYSVRWISVAEIYRDWRADASDRLRGKANAGRVGRHLSV